MLLSVSPSYMPRHLRELFNRITHLGLGCFHHTSAAHLLVPVFPLQNGYRSDFFLWLPPCGSNQARVRLTEAQGPLALVHRVPCGYSLSSLGIGSPSQASQQVVSCQDRHDVSGPVGGTANVGQDHWKGGRTGNEKGGSRALPRARVCQEKNKENPLTS